jgi:hypothetical protein
MEKLGKIISVFLALVFVCVTVVAQSSTEAKETVFKGYLADKMCGSGFTKSGDPKIAAAKAKKHTRDCALEDNCQASGFGLIIGAKYHKFDGGGDKIALDYLQKSKKSNNLWVEVKGTANGDDINVVSIADARTGMSKEK